MAPSSSTGSIQHGHALNIKSVALGFESASRRMVNNATSVWVTLQKAKQSASRGVRVFHDGHPDAPKTISSESIENRYACVWIHRCGVANRLVSVTEERRKFLIGRYRQSERIALLFIGLFLGGLSFTHAVPPFLNDTKQQNFN